MKQIKFKKILTKSGWKEDALVVCDHDGMILSITENGQHPQAQNLSNLIAIPGFINAHSHAFQYAMAGMAESVEIGHLKDDFWSWRNHMYDLALTISPQKMHEIAFTLYSRMRLLGYVHVVEFHYLHHDTDGRPYGHLAEMSEQLIHAAQRADINITIVPVYYNTSDFAKPALESQRRFLCKNPTEYFQLIESVASSVKHYDGANLGIGIHSLRAAPFDHAVEILKAAKTNQPIHLHIAEQMKEVESSLAFCGKRPVEWLLENNMVNHQYNLVHSTHLVEAEVMSLAKSQASVVLCPTTEGNLGDGIFPLVDYIKYNGRFSIGSDSHVSISPLDELKFLDYVQRLIFRKRNVLCFEEGTDSGILLMNKIIQGGSQAHLLSHSQNIEIGQKLNATLIDAHHPVIQNKKNEGICSALIYAADQHAIVGTVVRGHLHLNKLS